MHVISLIVYVELSNSSCLVGYLKKLTLILPGFVRFATLVLIHTLNLFVLIANFNIVVLFCEEASIVHHILVTLLLWRESVCSQLGLCARS